MRDYSLAYLTACHSTVPEAVDIAHACGYRAVGLRVRPNAPGAPYQALLGDEPLIRETLARLQSTGVTVFDLEIIRLDAQFQVQTYEAMLALGQRLGARAVLVAADDLEPVRLAQNYARLCEFMQPFGLSANLEFMPWTAVRTANEAQQVIRAAGEPGNAGVLVDALHFGRSHTTLQDIRDIPRSWIHYAQICDAEAGTAFTTEQLIHTAREERLLPGEGTIDLAGLFRAIPGDIPVSVEVVNLSRSRAMGDAAWARLALEASRRVVDNEEMER